MTKLQFCRNIALLLLDGIQTDLMIIEETSPKNCIFSEVRIQLQTLKCFDPIVLVVSAGQETPRTLGER